MDYLKEYPLLVSGCASLPVLLCLAFYFLTRSEEQKPRKSCHLSEDWKTPVKTKAVGEPQIRVSPPKTPPNTTDTDLSVTEEDMASVEAAAKKIRDSLGGTSLEIVLSPAIKKVNTLSLF